MDAPRPVNAAANLGAPAAGNVVTACAAFAVSKGLTPDEITEALGVTLPQLLAPPQSLSETLLPPLLVLLADRFPGESIPLQMVQMAPASIFGIVGEVGNLAPDLRTALQTHLRFIRLISREVRVQTTEVPGGLRVALAHPNDAIDRGLGAELALGMSARRLRETLGLDRALLRVEFSHRPNAPLQRYSEFFRVPVTFERDANALTYRQSALSFPLSPNARAHFEAGLRHLQLLHDAMITAQHTVDDEVRRAIAANAVSGDYRAESVARALNVSVRTLQRRVRDRGESLRALLEQAREDNARRLLEDRSLPVLEVAMMLGYTTESAFRRAFRKWTGKTPVGYRRHM